MVSGLGFRTPKMDFLCRLLSLSFCICSVSAVGEEIEMNGTCDCNITPRCFDTVIRQSPMNLNNTRVLFDGTYYPYDRYNISMWTIFRNDHKYDKFILRKTKNTLVITPADGKRRTHRATFYPNNIYDFHNVHFHFSAVDDIGSEHTINYRSFPVEAHFLHWNSENFATVEEAATFPFGIRFVVISVLFEKDTEGNSNPLDHFSDMLDKITGALLEEGPVEISKKLSLASLFNDQDFAFAYRGSFTSNKCYQSIAWFVLTKPVLCSSKLIEQFRSLWNSFKSGGFRRLQHVDDWKNVGIANITINFEEPK